MSFANGGNEVERSLVEQAKRGDREAFTRLAFELSDRLFAVAHRILRDFDAAGDAIDIRAQQVAVSERP